VDKILIFTVLKHYYKEKRILSRSELVKMVQALGSVNDEPSSLCICGHNVQRVESFVYLGAMIHSSCSSDPEIRRHSAMTRSAMQSLDRHLWRSRITNKTKLHLYRVFTLPIGLMLYGSECWAINKADIQRIDAVDQWCLRRVPDTHWHDCVRNADIRRITNQPPLSSIIKSRHLTFFGDLA